MASRLNAELRFEFIIYITHCNSRHSPILNAIMAYAEKILRP
ncbi:hypothetical protein FX987_02480 [Vreelandella titanicae]|uniref:Uncharacterized protein n=1 Tax=Vreelandella titanicae TaxID=664683 RepID=A0AAP9NMS3_9GAMM|nr:hypothetical protein FX987_02480 [Halomonas titanicae]